MDDKKNEDFAIEMGDLKGRSSPSSRDSFLSSKSGSSRGGVAPPAAISSITNSPPISILAYCLASISMTVTNKYCVSGANWNLNFFYLAIQVNPLNRKYPIRIELIYALVSCLYYCYYHLQASGHDNKLGAIRSEESKDM